MTIVEAVVIGWLTVNPGTNDLICTVTDTALTVSISCIYPLSSIPLTTTIKRENEAGPIVSPHC